MEKLKKIAFPGRHGNRRTPLVFGEIAAGTDVFSAALERLSKFVSGDGPDGLKGFVDNTLKPFVKDDLMPFFKNDLKPFDERHRRWNHEITFVPYF